jgi:hypothetical protein
MSRGVPPFINAKKWLIFPRKRCGFGPQMVGFIFQIDLGIVKNVFHGVNGFQHLEK